MVLPSDGISFLNKTAGQVFRIQYFTSTVGSVWDDQRTLTQSGTDLWVSGVWQELVDKPETSEDAVLIEQGRLSYHDSRLIISSDVQTTSGDRVFTANPSGTSEVYKQMLPGMHQPMYKGSEIFKKVYLRILPNGSLF